MYHPCLFYVKSASVLELLRRLRVFSVCGTSANERTSESLQHLINYEIHSHLSKLLYGSGNPDFIETGECA